ncbi:ABC transporter ATP-binding protein [Paenisporosarcina cavernae]|uniref:ABC transporter ATP-binding protein n=1 Tax=Paenisporosarcina cavernae TaxID=2320858 RepID=A0A385YRT4_9BACL|nr:ABC transporter ATP-binding protein [Paenisporosarcina cavernae]AYC28432.1 ABC transporter ATP-binding protein [Paenisporosarcina cavernae]
MDITVSHVHKSFDKVPVIQDISLTIPSGNITCFLGPSGSGKTTLIRLIIGATHADEGSVSFAETKMPNMELLKKIGFMPQNDALYPDLSAEANLHFFSGLYAMEKSHLAARIEHVLQLVELTADRKKLVKHYSGGMKKRLSLAIALLHEPDFLFLDEPTVGIDPVLRRTIWQQFQAFKNSGTTIIISTHVMEEVLECDVAALIYNGSLIEYGSVTELVEKTENGRIEELFLSAASHQKAGNVT